MGGWAGAAMQKLLAIQKYFGHIDRWTHGETDQHGKAYPRLKTHLGNDFLQKIIQNNP